MPTPAGSDPTRPAPASPAERRQRGTWAGRVRYPDDDPSAVVGTDDEVSAFFAESEQDDLP